MRRLQRGWRQGSPGMAHKVAPTLGSDGIGMTSSSESRGMRSQVFVAYDGERPRRGRAGVAAPFAGLGRLGALEATRVQGSDRPPDGPARDRGGPPGFRTQSRRCSILPFSRRCPAEGSMKQRSASASARPPSIPDLISRPGRLPARCDPARAIPSHARDHQPGGSWRRSRRSRRRSTDSCRIDPARSS